MTGGLYIKLCISLTVIVLMVYTPGWAQQRMRHEFNFRNDNDLYLLNKQDQYYTNGILFNFRKIVSPKGPKRREIKRLWGLTIGQKMYNAYTAHIRYIEEVDRPITAYLFAAANLDRYFADESFLSIKGEFGMIGQQALGRQFQEGIHKVLNLYEIAGWEYQLENAVGADVALHYGRLLYRTPKPWLDLSGHTEAVLGTNHTGISLSPTIRIGQLNALHQSAYTASRLQTNDEAVAKELFFYYTPQLNWVGYDATLQGGMFLSDKGPVTYRPARWVFYNQIGVLYARETLTLRLQYTFYSKEVSSMFFRHRYGSVGMGLRF